MSEQPESALAAVGRLDIARIGIPWDECENPWRIDHADPVARIHDEFLLELHQLGADFDWHPDARYVSLRDDVLTIKAKNRTVVYVIERDQYDAATNSYRMHWPD